MPKISDFQPKKSSNKGEWDISSFTSSPEATRPQRRPGRGDDAPAPVAPEEHRTSSTASQSAAAPFLRKAEPELDQIEARGSVSPIEAGSKTGNKPRTNREQSGNKLGTKLGTNREQSGNSPELTNPPKTESGNKVGAKPGTELRTNREQNGNKLGTDSGFLALSGLQRNSVLFLYSICRSTGSRETGSIRLDAFSVALETTTGAAKETLKRLIKKGFVERVSYRDGRGGFSNYRLPEAVYRELFELETGNKLGTKWEQIGNKVGAKVGTQLGTNPPSSSSSLDLENFKTTTTGEPELFTHEAISLATEWERIDLSPLSEIGFTQTHLIQIARQGKLSAQETQDSIHYFAFDLKRNGKAKELNGPPLNFFMGILRKGMPYTPPENFEAPEEEARRKYREGKQRLEAKRMAEAEVLWDLHFREWEANLNPKESEKFLPEYAKRPGTLRENALKHHFNEQVWPELRESIPGYESLFAGMLTPDLKVAESAPSR